MQNQLENRANAGFLIRFIAFAIDCLIAACVVSTIKTPFTMASAAGVKIFDANFLFQYSFLDVLDYVGTAAYFTILTYTSHTTLGKMLVGIEVVSEKEWTLLNVIYRETIGRFFSSLMCIGYFAVIVTKNKQGFHDMLCDTRVVYKNLSPRKKEESDVMSNEAPVPTAILDDEIIDDEDAPFEPMSQESHEEMIHEPVETLKEEIVKPQIEEKQEYKAPTYYAMQPTDKTEE